MATIARLSLVALLYLAFSMDRAINVYDEGLILFGAARVMDGDIPHRDFYANYGPGQFYALAALFKVFGASILIERAWDTVVRCCSVVLVFIVVGQVAPHRFALLAAQASLVCLGAVGAYGYPVFPALAAALASLALLVPIFGRAGPAPGLIAAGGCAGVATLFRYDVGFATFGAECAILACSLWFQSLDRAQRLRAIIRALILSGLGFAVVVMPVAAAFAFVGAIPDLIFDVVTFPFQFYVKTRSMPFPRLSPLGAWPEVIAVYLPLVLCAAAVPTMVHIARYQRGDESAGPRPTAEAALPWTLLALVVLTLVFFAKGAVRPSAIHMAMSLVTSLALAGVLAQPIPGRGLVGRSMVVVAILACSMFILFSASRGMIRIGLNTLWLTNAASWELTTTGLPPASGSCRMPAGLERLACFQTSPEIMETIRYVQQRTTPDDKVFIGLARHDKIFVNDLLLYFAMNRRSATKWHHFDPGLQTSAPIQREMVGELQRAKLKFVVIAPTWTTPPEPNDSEASSGVTLLDDYLRRDFEPVATFGAYTVLRARAPEPPQ